MNPLTWSREHQIAFGIACLLGALSAMLIAFIVWASYTRGAVTLSLIWLEMPLAIRWWPWPIFGAVTAALTFYMVKLLRA